jgi:hypothetical protein
MLLFIQDATRYPDEHILKNRLEALEKLKEWKALREKDSGKQVKQFRTDGGCEYSSKKFAQYLKSEGILKETTTTYSPQCNGFVEWANRIILERMRCMLADTGLSKKFWAFAVSVVVYLKNHTLTHSGVGRTPYEPRHGSGQMPWLKHLCVFDCLAFLPVPKEKRKKLDYRATPSIFVGYSVSTKQNFVYDRSTTTLHHSRHVVFREGKWYTAPNAAGEAMLNEHHYRDVIEEPKPTEAQPTSDENSKGLTEELLDDDSPPDPLKPKKS